MDGANGWQRFVHITLPGLRPGVAYGVAKAASDRMAACMAHDLRPHRVAAVSLHPGLVRTEAVLKHPDSAYTAELLEAAQVVSLDQEVTTPT